METLEDLREELERVGEHVQLAEEETTPAEMDPLAAAEQARDAMEAMLHTAESERDEEAAKRRDLEVELEKVRLDLCNAQAATAQHRANVTDLARLIKQEREGRKNDRKKYEDQIGKIRKHVNKPVRWPLILGTCFGVLSLLVGLCMDHDLMTCVLGDPLAAGLLAVCALFYGVSYERLRLR